MNPSVKNVEGAVSENSNIPNDDPIRVMVVDDSAVIRGLITMILEEDSGVKVAVSAGNGELAVKNLSRYEIDVIVLDIEMPVMDGLTALPLLLKVDPGIKIIMASKPLMVKSPWRLVKIKCLRPFCLTGICRL